MRLTWGKRREAEATYSPSGGLQFDDDRLESRLVWIWSAPRSGSTWFLRLLTHPVKIPDKKPGPDDYLGFRVPKSWPGTLRVLPIPTTFIGFHFDPVVGETGYTEGHEPKSLRSALDNKVSYFFSPMYSDVWKPELRRMILVRFNRMIEHARDEYPVDDPLLMIKEAGGGWSAPLIMSLFPSSRMIFLVRDGRDVVDSQVAGSSPGGWFYESAIGRSLSAGGDWDPERRAKLVRNRSHAWVGDVKSIRQAYETHDPELRRMVRYEDLLADPAEQIRALNDWLGLKRGGNWLDRAIEANAFDSVRGKARGPDKIYRSASSGSWRRNRSEEEQRSMSAIMNETLVELGYESG